MPSFKPVQNLSQATSDWNTPGWEKVPNFKSKDRNVVSGGKNYMIVTKEQRIASSTEQMIYKILNVLSLGILSACSKNIKNIITKGKETIRFAIPAQASPSAVSTFAKPTFATTSSKWVPQSSWD